VIRLRRQQWIAAAKEKPGTLTVGTSSAGTTNYLAALLFKSMQNLDFTVVPYRGPSELTVALLRNDVDLVINSYGGLAENGAAMKKMMGDMAVKPTGDVDADFVAMMVPHHQGAIDMALAVLRYGRNPQIRRLAQEIIVTQQQEIATMRLAVGQPLPSSTPSQLQGSPVRRIESKSSQPTDRAMEP
jgi:Domain of unknown function (DUF305)/Tripartite tricarboxylate transporter family receptor